MAVRNVGYSYTFAPLSNTLDLSAFPSFSIDQLYLVVDLTSEAVIYAPGTDGLGCTASLGGVLTLQASMAGCQATDTLMIRYDDGYLTTAAPNVALVVAGAAVANGNPVPVEIVGDTNNLATDASLQTIITKTGTIGSSPPTIPGSGTGVLGMLRWLGSLISATLTSQGTAPNGSTVVGNPNLVAGSDGALARTLLTDGFGVQLTGGATSSAINISSANVVKASPGRVAKVSVIIAGSAAGTVNDCITTGAVSQSNEIAAIPNTVGLYTLDWPAKVGITVTPGTGQTISVSFI